MIATTQMAQNGSQSQLPLGLLHFIHKVLDGCLAKCCEAIGAGFMQTLIGMYGQSRMQAMSISTKGSLIHSLADQFNQEVTHSASMK